MKTITAITSAALTLLLCSCNEITKIEGHYITGYKSYEGISVTSRLVQYGGRTYVDLAVQPEGERWRCHVDLDVDEYERLSALNGDGKVLSYEYALSAEEEVAGMRPQFVDGIESITISIGGEDVTSAFRYVGFTLSPYFTGEGREAVRSDEAHAIERYLPSVVRSGVVETRVVDRRLDELTPEDRRLSGYASPSGAGDESVLFHAVAPAEALGGGVLRLVVRTQVAEYTKEVEIENI